MRLIDRFGGRRATVGAVVCVVVLAGAAGVLIASASGTAGARPPSAGASGDTGASSSVAASSKPVKVIAAPVIAARPRRHGPATALTRLPFAGVANATRGVSIRLNGTPAPDTPRPRLTPAVAGHWHNVGDYEVFRPVSTLEPCTSYSMRIPARTFVLRHRTLGAARVVSFTVGCPGTVALQEALARLGYLPYALHGFVGASSTAALTRREAARRAYELPHGKLKPDVPGAPPLQPGVMDPATTGAVEVFEADHNLPLTTTPSAHLWVALIAAETLAKRDPKPYTWVTVTKTLPETLKVHEGSKVVLSSPTNTGVPGADTQDGVFPIYLRYVATTMIGTNVNGTHYDDPGVPWVNYFNGGDAVHGYIRPGYGYPQSNGCVELPIATAQRVFGMLQLGDLVIVS
jgi:hypothetical protein